MSSPKRTSSDSAFEHLAESLGVAAQYENMEGEVRDVPLETRKAMLAAMGISSKNDLPGGMTSSPPRLAVPDGVRCYLPGFLEQAPVWGIAAQVYELNSDRNWGIGDLEDIRTLCDIAAEAGADFIGLSPLHALFLSDPQRCSPYSPSNRSFLNPIFLALNKIPGFDHSLADSGRLKELRALPFVDYEAVTELKIRALRTLFEDWSGRLQEPLPYSHREFAEFKQSGGSELYGHCLFEALSFEMVSKGHGGGWHSWPEDFRHASSAAVAAFKDSHSKEVEFFLWLQWLMNVQLTDVAEHAAKAGLRLGLYFDFAVGEAPDGSSSWSTPDLVLADLRIGAPPDIFSVAGQDWGLVPLSPEALREQQMRPYRDLLKRTMRYAGALRLDHAMGIWQLFVMPEGVLPKDGGYLRYQFEEMVRVVADLSRETRTVMIGEDLGNVPDGFRPAMDKADILGYRVLYFEADADGFDPSELSQKALACLSTHDLPPLIGWWANSDINFGQRQGLYAADEATSLREDRELRKSSLLKAAGAPASKTEAAEEAISEEVVVALHRLLARSASMLAAVRLADLSGEERSSNIPGTSTEYPNWRARLQLPLEELAQFPLMNKIAAAMRAERPKT
ncbi:4-alpha-glucanotransferase [Neorhizobium lilium]|uniref:4-alpha-glucanotransferase n=1 Tax=Neorhizobium lilium TaxID=2503024 RepID=A0A444LKN3_9HYPH|nr:4-alpha-glucanotransferase [Neorhizobium lilium]RWX80865.1 4-alpha-glucanotransferase [Neorhizobium lilium]